MNRRFQVVGYPVRRELFEQDRSTCRAAFGLDDTPALFVYGGSRGARSINTAIAALLKHLLPICQIVHVCGREGDETFLREAAARLPDALQRRYQLYPYLYSGAPGVETGRPGDRETGRPGDRQPVIASPADHAAASMTSAFGAADLVVCRSGASTLGELPAAGLPAVLVPYPYVHQDENADYLVRHGAALKVPDGALLGDGRPEDGPLFQHIQRLIDHPEEREKMSARSAALARPDAAHRLGDLLLTLATSKRPRR